MSLYKRSKPNQDTQVSQAKSTSPSQGGNIYTQTLSSPKRQNALQSQQSPQRPLIPSSHNTNNHKTIGRNGSVRFDENTQRPVLESHEDINAYLGNNDNFDDVDGDNDLMDVATRGIKANSHLTSPPQVRQRQNHGDDDVTMDDLFGSDDENQNLNKNGSNSMKKSQQPYEIKQPQYAPRHDIHDDDDEMMDYHHNIPNEDEYDEMMEEDLKKYQNGENYDDFDGSSSHNSASNTNNNNIDDGYEPDDLDLQSSSHFNANNDKKSPQNDQKGQNNGEKEENKPSDLKSKQEERFRQNIPIRLAQRGMSAEVLAIKAQREAAEQKKRELKLAKIAKMEAKMEAKNAKNDRKSSKSEKSEKSRFLSPDDVEKMERDIESGRFNGRNGYGLGNDDGYSAKSPHKSHKSPYKSQIGQNYEISSKVVFTDSGTFIQEERTYYDKYGNKIHKKDPKSPHKDQKKENNNGNNANNVPNVSKLDETVSIFTRSALLTPFIPGSSKTAPLKTNFPSLNRDIIVQQHFSHQETLPPTLKYRYAEDLLGLGGLNGPNSQKNEKNKKMGDDDDTEEDYKIDLDIMNTYGEIEPYKEYLLYATAYKFKRGWGDMMSVGMPVKRQKWDDVEQYKTDKKKRFVAVGDDDDGDDDLNLSFNNNINLVNDDDTITSSSTKALRPCYLLMESFDQERYRLNARKREMELNQNVLMLNNELDRYLEHEDSYNETSQSYTIDLKTYQRLVKNLSIANRKAIVAKILKKTEDKAKKSTTQQLQQFESFLALLQTQHRDNIKHAINLKMDDGYMRKLQKKQQIEIEIFFKFLKAFEDAATLAFLDSLPQELHDQNSASTGLLSDANNIELIYNNTTVEYIKEFLFTDDKNVSGNQKHGQKSQNGLTSSKSSTNRDSLQHSLVNNVNLNGGDYDDEDIDGMKRNNGRNGRKCAKSDKNAQNDGKVVNSQLFVDKYAPQTYSQLLSPERYNKDVLMWLSKYNWLAFKKPVPQLSVPQYTSWKDRQNAANGPNEEKKPNNPSNGQSGQITTNSGNKNNMTDSMKHDITTKFGPQQQQKILLLAGPPGSGKTTLIRVLLDMLGYKKIEINSSEERGADSAMKIYDAIESKNVLESGIITDSMSEGQIMQRNRPKCVVLEEIDGAVGSNGGYESENAPTGAIQMLIKIAQDAISYDKEQISLLLDDHDDDDDDKKKNGDDDGEDHMDKNKKDNKKGDKKGKSGDKHDEKEKKTKNVGHQLSRPIIATCNFLQANCLKPLLPYCKIIELPSIEKSALMGRLEQVVEIENIAADQSFVKGLVELLGTDIRSCLHSLQFSSYNTISLQDDTNFGPNGMNNEDNTGENDTTPKPIHDTPVENFIYQLITQKEGKNSQNLITQAKSTNHVLTYHDLAALRIGQHDSPSSIHDMAQLVLTLQDVNPQSTMNDFMSSSTQRHMSGVGYLRSKYKITPPIIQLNNPHDSAKKATVIEPPKNSSGIYSYANNQTNTSQNSNNNNGQNVQNGHRNGEKKKNSTNELDNPGLLLDKKIRSLTISTSKLNLYHLLNSNLDTLSSTMTEYDSVPRVMEQVYFLHPLYTGYTPDIGKSSICSDICSLFESLSGKNTLFGASSSTAMGSEALACIPMLVSYHVNTFVANSFTSIGSSSQSHRPRQAPTDPSQSQQTQQSQLITSSNKMGGFLPIGIADLHSDPGTSMRAMYSNIINTAQFFSTKQWEKLQHSANVGSFIQGHYLPNLGQYITNKDAILHFLPAIYDMLIFYPSISHYPLLSYSTPSAANNDMLSVQDIPGSDSNEMKDQDDESDNDDEDDVIKRAKRFLDDNTTSNPSSSLSPTTSSSAQLSVVLSEQFVHSGTWQALKTNGKELDFLKRFTIPLMKKLKLTYQPTSIYIQNFSAGLDANLFRQAGFYGNPGGFLQKQSNLIPHLLNLVYFDFGMILKSFRVYDMMYNPYGKMVATERDMNCKLLHFSTLSGLGDRNTSNNNIMSTSTNNNIHHKLNHNNNKSLLAALKSGLFGNKSSISNDHEQLYMPAQALDSGYHGGLFSGKNITPNKNSAPNYANSIQKHQNHHKPLKNVPQLLPQQLLLQSARSTSFGENSPIQLIKSKSVVVGDMYFSAQRTAQLYLHQHAQNLPWFQQQQLQRNNQQLSFGFNNNIKHGLTQDVLISLAQDEEDHRQWVLQEQKRVAHEAKMKKLQEERQQKEAEMKELKLKLRQERLKIAQDHADTNGYEFDYEVWEHEDDLEQEMLHITKNSLQKENGQNGFNVTQNIDLDAMFNEENIDPFDENGNPLPIGELEAKKAQMGQKRKEMELLLKKHQEQMDIDAASAAYIKGLDDQYANVTGANVTIDQAAAAKEEAEREKNRRTGKLDQFITKTNKNGQTVGQIPSIPNTSSHNNNASGGLVDPFSPEGVEAANSQVKEAPKRSGVAASRANHTLQLAFYDGFSDAVKRPIPMSFFLE